MGDERKNLRVLPELEACLLYFRAGNEVEIKANAWEDHDGRTIYAMYMMSREKGRLDEVVDGLIAGLQAWKKGERIPRGKKECAVVRREAEMIFSEDEDSRNG